MVCNTTISISPETVTFMRDEHRQKKSLVIRNDGPQALMFKMKSTLAGALRMRPVHGQVEANASTTIKLELRWNSIVKRICVDSKKGRISVVFADAPHSPKPPPLFWRELKTQNKTTETITKKVQVKVESPTSHKPPSQATATEAVTSSDDKPQKPPPAGTGSDKPKKTSKEKAVDAAAKPATTKPETPPPPTPSATNVKKPKEEARVALTDGQAKAANPPGDQAQVQAKPGMEKPKEASNEKPPTTVLVTMNEKPAPKAAVGTAKETSDEDSSSSSSSSSKEEKK